MQHETDYQVSHTHQFCAIVYEELHLQTVHFYIQYIANSPKFEILAKTRESEFCLKCLKSVMKFHAAV